MDDHTQSPCVIAVTSGKGGVGKTNISINLALALADRGRKTMLLDADLGLANVDILLGLYPLRNLSHVISGECGMKDIIVQGPGGINVVPASSGVRMMSQLTDVQHASLVNAFDDLARMTDTLIVDTGAGISDGVVSFCAASQEVIIVLCNDPASLTDAYAMIKVLHKDYGIQRFRVLVNMVKDSREGRELFMRLVRVTERFLGVVLDFMGIIPEDPYMAKAIKRQNPIQLSYPSAPAAQAFKKLAKVADNWPRSDAPRGGMAFFLSSIVQARAAGEYGVHYE